MPNPEQILRVFRFGIVGGVVTLAFMGLNWWFGRQGLSENAAYLAAYPLAVALHFCLNKWWTFKDRAGVHRRQVSEYLGMMVVAFLIQTLVFKLLTHFTSLPPWLASGAATVAQMVLAFLFMQRRVFQTAAGKSDGPPL